MTTIGTRSAIALVVAIGLSALTAAANVPPPAVVDCNAEAVAPWVSAGEGYRAQASTYGPDCSGASLDLTLVAPSGRAVLEQHFDGAPAVRVLYGAPNGTAMEAELKAWISQTGDPALSSGLPVWAASAASPLGFEPISGMSRDDYETLRGGGHPLFCYAEAPGFDTCVALVGPYDVQPIGRLATR